MAKYYVQTMDVGDQEWKVWKKNDELWLESPAVLREFVNRKLTSGEIVVARIIPDEEQGISLSDPRIEHYNADTFYDWLLEPPEPVQAASVLVNGKQLYQLTSIERFREFQAIFDEFSMVDWRGRRWDDKLTIDQTKQLFSDAAREEILNAWMYNKRILYPLRYKTTKYWRFFLINQDELQDWSIEIADLMKYPYSVEKGVHVSANLDGLQGRLRQLLTLDVMVSMRLMR